MRQGDSGNPLDHRFSGETPVRTLLYLYRGERRRLIWGSVYHCIKHSPVWVMPWITANVIDIVAKPENHQPSELWWNAGILVLLLLQNIPINYLYVRSISKASRSLELKLRSALCRRLQHLSIGYYSRQSAGALQAKVLRDVESVEQVTRGIFETGLTAIVNLVFALLVTALNVPWFLLFFAASIPLTVWLMRLLHKHVTKRNATLRQEIESMNSRVGEMTSLIPITRAHALEGSALERIEASLARVAAAGLKVDETNAVYGAVSWVVFNAFNMGCLIFAAWACLTQFLPVTPGHVVMLTGYFGLLTGSVLMLAGAAPLFARGADAIKSIGEVLECPDLEQNEGKRIVGSVEGNIRFDHVGFRYEGVEAHAVSDFTLSVKAGETIALVGPSGAGKSTVLNLVIGFVRPTKGRIILDGQDMAELDLRSYRRWLSVVPQESILFDGTIRENVTYGMGTVNESVVRQALIDANAWEFVSKLPAGVETEVGERGARLSGGQKQRLAIARALIRNPRVLILDEATSALDTESEALIQEALERLMRNRTTFVVAHRLSTVRNATRIVVMQEGKIVEEGPHAKLTEAGGLYSRLEGLQRG
ncbi:MAG: ABC transporter ATP-binding protein [Opitutaceae bacterium]|nr:ABC transporter ATP-binding protein [Opitutaceae bacterium]